mmetsp:Transcript_38671/g.28023  ORF Transcript_38671/g.28023 Transcript_38671/m.28023 type:complete len:109 (-) Transcript_38671:901-1227(-)
METLLRAINHCHENGIVHRDLKPQNIMFNKHADIKMIDFGLSKMKTKQKLKNLYTKVGSINFVAPEVFTALKYNSKCDIWSLGVILYAMVSGCLPFHGSDSKETLTIV